MVKSSLTFSHQEEVSVSFFPGICVRAVNVLINKAQQKWSCASFWGLRCKILAASTPCPLEPSFLELQLQGKSAAMWEIYPETIIYKAYLLDLCYSSHPLPGTRICIFYMLLKNKLAIWELLIPTNTACKRMKTPDVGHPSYSIKSSCG